MSVDELITETADRLFGELCTHEAVETAEQNGGAPEVWAAFAETGFPWISLPEDAGGSGGTLLDALEVLRLVGYHAAPLPVAETGVLGGWLLASAGLELPEGCGDGGARRRPDDRWRRFGERHRHDGALGSIRRAARDSGRRSGRVGTSCGGELDHRTDRAVR